MIQQVARVSVFCMEVVVVMKIVSIRFMNAWGIVRQKLTLRYKFVRSLWCFILARDVICGDKSDKWGESCSDPLFQTRVECPWFEADHGESLFCSRFVSVLNWY